jgi:hypothetical protein
MNMKTDVKETRFSFYAPTGETKEAQTVFTFRVKPSQVKYWKEKQRELGIKDFSAFIRGAVNSALFVSLRANDPHWQEFVEAAQPLSKKHLGHGFYDGGAKDIESSGTYYKTIPVEDSIAQLKKKHGIE